MSTGTFSLSSSDYANMNCIRAVRLVAAQSDDAGASSRRFASVGLSILGIITGISFVVINVVIFVKYDGFDTYIETVIVTMLFFPGAHSEVEKGAHAPTPSKIQTQYFPHVCPF